MRSHATFGKRIIAALLCGLLALAIPATQASAAGIVYDSTNGLITSSVNGACQTTDGYVWVAQYEGVSRYDGKRFTIFDTATADGATVDLELTSCLAADSQNRLYIGSKTAGLLVRENDVTRFAAPYLGSNVSDVFVYDDVAYVATATGAYAYDPETDTATILPSTIGIDIASITADESGIYYAGRDGLVYRQTTAEDHSGTFFSEKRVKTVRAFDGTVYLGGSFGDLITIGNGEKTVRPVVESRPINAITVVDGVVFVGTDVGSYSIDGDKVSRMTDVPDDATVEGMFVDYEGSLWFATNQGLIKSHHYPVTNLLAEYGEDGRVVNACTKYGDLLYAGTESGLLALDEKGEHLVSNKLTQALDGVRVRDLVVLDGTLYVATYSSEQYSLLAYDGTTVTDIAVTDMLGGSANAEAMYSHGQVRCLATQGGRLLVGTNYGLSEYADGTWKTIAVSPRPLSIATYADRLYVCTDGDGIKIYDYDLNEIETVPGTEEQVVLRTMEYADGLLYTVGTKIYYLCDGTATMLETPNRGSVVDLVDAGDTLGIYSAGGVLFVDKATLLTEEPVAVREFDYDTGLLSGIVANGRSYRDPETGIFYLNAHDGVYRYDPAEDAGSTGHLKMVVDGLQVDGQASDYKSGNIRLGRDVTRLTVDFDVLSFLEGSDIAVHYKLEGVDTDFNELDYSKSQTIEYTNLAGGDYTLLIYATSSQGTESNLIEVPVTKDRKVYEMPAVIIAAIITGLSVLVLVRTRHEMRQIEKESERRKEMTVDSISAIVSAVDAKDGYTKGHSVRVAKLSVAIAREMGMSQEDLDNIYYVGLMHDVGKIGIPDEILRKPGSLTDEEYALIKRHPEVGYQIIKPIRSLPELTFGVMCHHERWDGGGYPHGLKGEEIPLIGRIVCCADSYDALATRRCYRESIPDEGIVEKFRRCSGTQFDPKIAAIAIRLIQNGTFRRIIEEDPDSSSDQA